MVSKRLFPVCIVLGLLMISFVSAWDVQITKLNDASIDAYYSDEVHIMSFRLTDLNCTDVAQVWFSDDDGLTTSPKGCAESGGEVRLTSLNSAEGNNSWMIIVEHNDNTTKNTSVNFWVDSIEPVITVTNPSGNLGYTNGNTLTLLAHLDETNKGGYDGNFSANPDSSNRYFWRIFQYPLGGGHWNSYSLDSSNNSDLYHTLSLIGDQQQGSYSFTIKARDIYPDGSTIREVTETGVIIRDTISPEVNINSPLDGSNSTIVVDEIQYTVEDDNLDYCEVEGVNSGCSNGVNIYSISSVEGINNWSVAAYDKAGNSNTTSVSFFVDSIAPQIEILSPIAGSYNYDFTELNFSAFDVALESCWFDNGTDVSIVSCSNNITGITSIDRVNTWTLYANDSFGHVNSSTVIFTVDTTAPVITLNDSNNISIEIGGSYIEFNATAVDNMDGDVTNNIVIDSSDVNTSALGSYNVTYDVSDAAGNAATTVIRVVNVVDTTAPVITFLGDNPQYVEYNNSYVEAGANVTDNSGESLSAIIDNSTVDVNVLGSYNVSYYAEDSSGNNATVLREVIVVDTTPPIITILPGNDTIERMDNFTDAGATAWDNYDGNLNASIVITSDVDENVAGSYTVEYYVGDSNENNATSVRNVTVEDTVTPTIEVFAPVFNTTYTTDLISLKVGSDESINWKYSLNNGVTNVSFAPNTTLTLGNGNYNLFVYVADAVGNENSTNVSFTVNKPAPKISSSSGGSRSSCVKVWNCSQWGRWSVCSEEGIQYRTCSVMEKIGCGEGMEKDELEALVQSQSCSLIIRQEGSSDSDEDIVNVESNPESDESISPLTGGVIGFMKTKEGLATTITILVVLSILGALQIKKRRIQALTKND